MIQKVNGQCRACRSPRTDLDPLWGLCVMCFTSPFWKRKMEAETVAENFEVKSTGDQTKYDSGMLRNNTKDKIDYSLALDGPMFERVAIHLTKALKYYAARNWMQASTEPELARFRESAIRHFYQWLRGDMDEDHAAALFFNVNGYEYTKERLVKNPRQG